MVPNVLHHRRLVTYPKAIQTKAEIISKTHGTTDKTFPKVVGKYFKPFGTHNYAYGISVVETVAEILNTLDGSGKDFVEIYNTYYRPIWRDLSIGAKFESEFKRLENSMTIQAGQSASSKVLLNQDEMIVLFSEYKVLDCVPMMEMANGGHLITWALSLVAFFAIFGMNSTALTLIIWLVVIGVILTEAFSYMMPVTGSSIIGFGFMGATLFGIFYRNKSWKWYNIIVLIYTVSNVLGPMILDPPLPQKLFLSGKQVSHAGHHTGLIYGIIATYFAT